jgi:hypothetical protein
MSNHPIEREYSGHVDKILSSVEVVSVEDPVRSEKCIGVWDTGAMLTMITPNICSGLNLTQIDKTFISGVHSGKKEVPVVLIDLILEDKIRIPSVRAAVSEIPDLDMLIGIDVIQQGDFSISTVNHKTLFKFTYTE